MANPQPILPDDINVTGWTRLFTTDFNDLTYNDSSTDQISPGASFDQDNKVRGVASLSLALNVDDPELESGVRSEVFQFPLQDVTAYTEFVCQWYHLIPDSWQPEPGRIILGQLHDDQSAPPFSFGVRGKHWWYRTSVPSVDFLTRGGLYNTRQWTRHQVLWRPSDTTDGIIRVFRDGELVYSKDGQNKVTMTSPAGDFQIKAGIYNFMWNAAHVGPPDPSASLTDLQLNIDEIVMWGR